MLKRLADAVLLIRTAKSAGELKSVLELSAVGLGFSTFSFSCNVQDPREMVMSPMLTNWSQDFQREYFRQKWIRHDVILEQALRKPEGISWTSGDLGTECAGQTDPRQRNFMRFLGEMGMDNGIVLVSVHCGLHTGISFESPKQFERNLLLLQAASVIANAATIKAESLRIPVHTASRQHGLSAQQIEILKWVAEGKSNADIATIVGQTRRAVDYHMAEILRKLGVATRAQAVAVFLGVQR